MFLPTSDNSAFAKAVSSFASQLTATRLIAAASVLEASFYGCLTMESGENRLIKQIRTFAIENSCGFQQVFNTVNTVASLYFARRLLSAAEHRFDFSAAEIGSRINRLTELPGLPGNIMSFAFYGTILVIVSGVLTHFDLIKTKDKEALEESNRIVEGKSRDQKIAKLFHTAKLGLNCAWLVFSKDRFVQLIDLPATAYSFFKNNQLTCRLEHGVLPNPTAIAKNPSEEARQQSDDLSEKLLVGYTVVQAGLAYLQTYPELAATVYKIQIFMAVADCFFQFQSSVVLNDRLKKSGLNKDTTMRITGISLLTIIPLASYFAMSKINAYTKSTLVLKEILNKLPIDPNILKNVSVDWGAPVDHQFLQYLYINRVVASLALSFFEKNRKWHLLATAAQLFTLGRLSDLKWIAFEQMFHSPLKTFVKQGANLSPNVTQEAIQTLTLRSHFLVSRFQAISPVRLEKTLQAIYDFTQKTFVNSSWNRFWGWVRDGVYHVYSLHYSVKLQNPMMEMAEHLVPPAFWDRSLSILDKTNHWAIVHIYKSNSQIDN